MAKAVKQFRYYNENHVNNSPQSVPGSEDASLKSLYVNGFVFETPYCYPILQLGIQTLPGTKFYLNSSVEPIIIGFTGIYELDLDNQTEITKITFNEESMTAIENNPNGYLIIDILYDKTEGEGV